MEGKILIVDDDLDTLQLVGTMLERQGFEISAANNGENAIEAAQEQIPDLILLDIMMPGIDGYEVTRQIRGNANTAFIPIIMFTAKAQVDDKVEGLEAGADDYLTKPTHPAELIARVRAILTRPKTGISENGDTDKHLPAGQMIGVLAAKGGMGVSTLSINLGVGIHQNTDEYVIVAEFRPGQGDIGVYLGYKESQALNNLLHSSPGNITLQDVENQLINHGSGVQLLLSSYTPSDVNLLHAVQEYRIVAKHLSKLASYIVIDLGSGLSDASLEVAKLCDDLLIVVEPTNYSIIQTKSLITELEEKRISKERIKVVMINRVRMEISVPRDQIQRDLGFDLSGALTPAPELTYQAAMRHQPVINHQPSSVTASQISKLAATIAKPVKKTEQI